MWWLDAEEKTCLSSEVEIFSDVRHVGPVALAPNYHWSAGWVLLLEQPMMEPLLGRATESRLDNR